MEEPLLTESLPWGGGIRELLGPAPDIPIYFHEQLVPRSDRPHLRGVSGAAAAGHTAAAATNAANSDVVDGSKRAWFADAQQDAAGELDKEACETRDEGGTFPISCHPPTSGAPPGGTPPPSSAPASAPPVTSPRLSTPTVSPPPASSFRWSKTSWLDGGRANSLAFGGGSVLLSRVGWERWRAWAGAASAGVGEGEGEGDEGGGGYSSSSGGGGGGSGDSSRAGHGRSSLAGKGSEGDKESDPAEPHLDQREGGGGLAITADRTAEVEAALIAEVASAFDLHLSGTCLVLEPWDYAGTHCAKGARFKSSGREGFEGGMGRGGGGGDGAALVVRADLSMRMTSGLFLDGHWMVELGADVFSST